MKEDLKLTYEKALHRKEIVCSLFGTDEKNPFIQLISYRFNSLQSPVEQSEYIDDVISEIVRVFDDCGQMNLLGEEFTSMFLESSIGHSLQEIKNAFGVSD